MDPSCCPDALLTDSIHLDSTKSRASVIKLLKSAQRVHSNYTFKAKGRKKLKELVGLPNNERCEWNIDVDDDSISSLKTKVYLGQTVSFSYEPVEEEGSGGVLMEKSSKKRRSKKSKTGRRG